MANRNRHHHDVILSCCVLIVIIICLSALPSSAKTQSSTEWKRKWNSINQTDASSSNQRNQRKHHRAHRLKGIMENNNNRPPKLKKRPIINATKLTNISAVHVSPWSSWSKCNKKCRQFRQRKCHEEAHNKCNQSVLRQERACRRGRCKRKAFHVVLPPKRESLKQPSQSDVRVLLSLNSIFYSSWSRWTPCTKLCTTNRHRSCSFPVVCGNTILHEEAYCYTEGTDCEKWYSSRSRYNKDANNEKYKRGKGVPRRGQHKKDETKQIGIELECGVPLINPSHGLQLRIIGGREAAPGKWPWQVAILNRFKEAFCGGTLIGTRWVLTAAHCLRKRLYVRIGEYDLVEDDGTEIDFRVEEVFVHPDYDPETVDNDVALLRLPEAIKLGQGAGLACLPKPSQSLPLTQKCTIIGWGKERSSHVFGTEVLHEAEVPIVKTSTCREVYEDYFITENMFCAGYRKGRIDSCAGDSGGPLLCPVGDRWTIFGITSFGEGCGKRGKYGIYTKVPNYVSWIERVIDLNGGI